MISRKTVLVLGAGASKPFGFPLGRELVDTVTGQLALPPDTDLGKFLIGCGFESSALQKFAYNLRLSQRNSIDAFLEHRPEFLAIGKAAIASVLIGAENEEALFKNGDWYRYLFHHLNTSFEDFSKNSLVVVTFNYDRSLEFYLAMALANAYGKPPTDCMAKAASIPIVHVHGKMGDILAPSGKFRAYHHHVHQEAMQLAAEQIKIIHETGNDEEQFIEARKYIKAADVVCFLGFGYDQNNIKRLFPTLQSKLLLRNQAVFGSAYGLTLAESERAKALLNVSNHMQMGNGAHDCLQFLRENHVF